MSAQNWEPVAQTSGRRVSVPRLSLTTLGPGAGRSVLCVTIPGRLADELGWSAGVRLGLHVGRAQWQGFVRVAPDADGRMARATGRTHASGTLIAALVPPVDWQHLTAPTADCAYRIQGDVLLAEIPWDMDNIAPPEAAEEEAA